MGLSDYLKRKAMEKVQKSFGGVKQSALKRCPKSPDGRHKMSYSARQEYNIEDDEGQMHKVVLHMCGHGCGKVMKET